MKARLSQKLLLMLRFKRVDERPRMLFRQTQYARARQSGQCNNHTHSFYSPETGS